MLIHSLFVVKAKKIIIILQGNAHHFISKDHLLYWETKRLLLDGFHFKDVLTCNNTFSFLSDSKRNSGEDANEEYKYSPAGIGCRYRGADLMTNISMVFN